MKKKENGFTPNTAMGSLIEVEVKNSLGEVVFTKVFHNLYTYSFAAKLLRTLVQTSSGDHMDATDWAKKVAISSGVYPSSPASSDISDVESYEDLSAATAITETSTRFTVTRSATWTNATGLVVNVTYLALTYGASVSASQVYCMVNLDSVVPVSDGSTLNINYVNYVTKDTSFFEPI